MLDPLRVFVGFDGRHDLVQEDRDDRVFPGLDLDLDLDRLGVEVTGRASPILTLALVLVELDDLAVAPRESRVDVEPRLDEVFAGRDVAEAPHRVAERRLVDERLRAGGQAVDVQAEDGRPIRPRAEFFRPGKKQDDAPRGRLAPDGWVDRDLEFRIPARPGRAGPGQGQDNEYEDGRFRSPVNVLSHEILLSGRC